MANGKARRQQGNGGPEPAGGFPGRLHRRAAAVMLIFGLAVVVIMWRWTAHRGRGTTATITLAAVADGGEAAPAPAEAAEAQERAGSRRLSILAADDDALVLMNTGDLLEDLGLEVAPAYSSQDALEQLSGRDFDRVVTDHAMPRMTGAQLIAEAGARKPALPILLATGYADLPPGVGPIDVPRLSKPFSQLELKRAIETLIRA